LEKLELLYEGKAKRLFTTNDENFLIAEFKDDLTAFNALKKGSEAGKGALNNKISTQLFKLLESKGVATHLVETIDETHQLIKACKIIPIEVVVRNVATGSLTKRLGIEDGEVLPFPLIEFYYKDDALGDPLINDEHCLILNLVKSESDLEVLRHLGREINTIMKAFFAKRNLNLVDFKVEFGIDKNGMILLADEISPDSCRFWDMTTNEKLDKDRFRQGLGDVKVAYEEVLKRILTPEGKL
jgi:phosphoribosylaminoimidazole-succinocarboxamide synthase